MMSVSCILLLVILVSICHIAIGIHHNLTSNICAISWNTITFASFWPLERLFFPCLCSAWSKVRDCSWISPSLWDQNLSSQYPIDVCFSMSNWFGRGWSPSSQWSCQYTVSGYLFCDNLGHFIPVLEPCLFCFVMSMYPTLPHQAFHYQSVSHVLNVSLFASIFTRLSG